MKQTGVINKANSKKKPRALLKIKRSPPGICKNCSGKKLKS